MLKIGEFSKLSHITVKALRYYEQAGILVPMSIDEQSGYRYYETAQLSKAAKITEYRRLKLSISEIKRIFAGADRRSLLLAKAQMLKDEKKHIDTVLSAINLFLEEEQMQYQVTEKVIPKMTVYTAETVLKDYSVLIKWIPSVGAACVALNPGLTCAEPPYEFCEYLDGEYKETGIRVRHVEAVTSAGIENEQIKFSELPAAKVLSILHKGPYESIGEAYSYILNYAAQKGFAVNGLPRECYIDGIWNQNDPADWLTEIQLPVQ